ncbi:MAG: sortase [Clostridia bacterium]|nr:sortase [Clostridia bacterium]
MYGNLCIAGHNYKNDTFFSNISKLNYGDIIEIHDNNRENFRIFGI